VFDLRRTICRIQCQQIRCKTSHVAAPKCASRNCAVRRLLSNRFWAQIQERRREDRGPARGHRFNRGAGASCPPPVVRRLWRLKRRAGRRSSAQSRRLAGGRRGRNKKRDAKTAAAPSRRHRASSRPQSESPDETRRHGSGPACIGLDVTASRANERLS